MSRPGTLPNSAFVYDETGFADGVPAYGIRARIRLDEKRVRLRAVDHTEWRPFRARRR